MFRAFVLSTVLTVVAGPSASLLCRTWCDQKMAAPSECHHEESSDFPSVADDGRCDQVVGGVAAFLREDVRRGVLSPDGSDAAPVLRYHLVYSTIDARAAQEHGREWSLENRPLATALRV